MVEVGGRAQFLIEHREQLGDLAGVPLPILGREGVQGEVGQPDLQGAVDDLVQGLDTRAVSLGTRQAALLSPAAVTVHNDRDVPRYPVGGDLGGPDAVRAQPWGKDLTRWRASG